MTYSRNRGRYIEFHDGKWYFSDTQEEINGKVKCNHCGMEMKDDEYDSCLGKLPGVKYACCGHGEISECYIQFLDDTVIRGKDAKDLQDILKKYRKEI
jgi:hypothetical protein